MGFLQLLNLITFPGKLFTRSNTKKQKINGEQHTLQSLRVRCYLRMTSVTKKSGFSV